MPRNDASLLAAIAALRRAHEEPTWKLLTAHNGPEVISILRSNFYDAGAGRVPAARLVERVADDLRAIERTDRNMLLSPQKYISDWVGDGWLLRDLSDDGTEEVYDLSPEALHAILLVEQITTPASSATESKISSTFNQLTEIAVATDENDETRLAALIARREELDRHIADVLDGRTAVTGDEQALEAVRGILRDNRQHEADFARLKRSVDTALMDLRRQAIESDGARGDVLELVLQQVNQLDNTDFGRSFKAFYQVLGDPERIRGLEATIEALLSRPFADKLTAREYDELQDMIPKLLRRASDVHAVFDALAGKLRSFVEDRHFAEERRVDQIVRDIYGAYRTLSQTQEMSGRTKVPYELELSTSEIRSIGQIQPKQVDTTFPDPVDDNSANTAPDILTLSHLVEESDIDFPALRKNIADAVAAHGSSSIATVLKLHPAAQGLASLIGLVLLGLRGADEPVKIATVYAGKHETVSWTDGRYARIPKIIFYSEESHV